MTSHPGIQQFECRWQPSLDLSPIAASGTLDEARWWFRRLELWLRPDAPDHGVPAESVRYAVFDDDQKAALAWRYWNENAMALYDRTERQPVVARVLVGDVRQLTPEVAVAICRKGLPPAVGPEPGQVTSGYPLPPIAAEVLSELAHDSTDELDEAASSARGLGGLIAAALSDYDTPLCVQIPERTMGLQPQKGGQGPLLWGLWRIAGPLLAAGPDFQRPGKRGWSFSTYEPPFGNKATKGLADIVFRNPRVRGDARSTRLELIVRPYDQAAPTSPVPYEDLAHALVQLFRDNRGSLLHYLGQLASTTETADKRIETAFKGLLNRPMTTAEPISDRQSAQPAGSAATKEEHARDYAGIFAGDPALPSTRSGPLSGTSKPPGQPAGPVQPVKSPSPATAAAGHAAQSEVAHESQQAELAFRSNQEMLSGASSQADMLQRTTASPEPSFSPADRPGPEPSGEHTRPGQGQASARGVGGPIRSPATSREAADEDAYQQAQRNPAGWDRPEGRSPESPRTRSETTRSPSGEWGRDQVESRFQSVSDLFSRLYVSRSGDPGHEAIREYLAANFYSSLPTDRATVREGMAEHGWYMDALSDPDPWQAEGLLERIFIAVVIPDLHLQAVAEEVTRWVGEFDAPIPVVRALSAAAQHRGSRAQEMMENVLVPVLGQRWLSENCIPRGALRNIRAASAGTPAGGRRPANAAQDPEPRRASLTSRLVEDNVAFALLMLCTLLVGALAISLILR